MDVINTLEPSALSSENIIEDQSNVSLFTEAKSKMEQDRNTRFFINAIGLLCQRYHDKRTQIVVPQELCTNILQSAKHSMVAGHVGWLRMYATLRKSFPWPSMSFYTYCTLQHCIYFSREIVRHKNSARLLKLLPVERLIQYVSIYILGHLPRTARHSFHLVVIKNRYIKMTQVALIHTTTGLSVARDFCDKWMFLYGPPQYLLSDIESRFCPVSFRNYVRLSSS